MTRWCFVFFVLLAGVIQSLSVGYYTDAQCVSLVHEEEVEDGVCVPYASGGVGAGYGLNVPSAFSFCMRITKPPLAVLACPYHARGVTGWHARFSVVGDLVHVDQAYGDCGAPAWRITVPVDTCNPMFGGYAGAWQITS